MKRLLCALVVAVTVASVAGIMAQTPDPGRGGVWVTGAGGAGGDITSVVAGAGMTGGGTEGDVTLNVIGTADAITVSADAVTIASTYVGQTSITTLGTVATGTWQATDVGVAYGGTGASTLTANSLLLGAGTSAVTFAAPGTSGNVLTSNGTVWASATPGTATSLDTGTVAYAGRTITVDTGGVLDVVLASAAGDDFTVDTNKLVVSGDTGFVGIGTAAPTRQLEVSSSSYTGVKVYGLHGAGLYLDKASATRVAELRYDTAGVTDWYVGTSDSDIAGDGTEYFIGTAGGGLNSALWIETNGNVGISTAAPVSLLDVRGPTGTGATPAGVLTLATNELTIVDGDQLGRLEFRSPIATAGTDAIVTAASIWAEANATFSASVNSADIVFATATSGAASERMRILSSGNVGIGAVAPGSLLEMSNPAGAAALTIRAGVTNVTAGVASLILISSHDDTGGASPPAEIRNIWGGTGDSDLAFYTTTDGSTMDEQMRITDVGNVGIGTAVPPVALSVLKSWTDAYASMSLSDSDNSSGSGITFYKNTFATRLGYVGYDTKFKVWNIQGTDMEFATNDVVRMTITDAGRVHMPAVYSVAGTGAALNIESDGNLFRIVSARRYKDNINYDNVNGDAVYDLRPVSYTLKDIENPVEEIGFIAEDVEEIDPRLVVYSKEGTVDALHYGRFSVLLVKAIQDQKATYDATLTQLDARIQELEAALP